MLTCTDNNGCVYIGTKSKKITKSSICWVIGTDIQGQIRLIRGSSMFFSKPKKWARAFLQVRRDAPIIRKAEHVVQNILFSPYLINPTLENVQVMRQSEFEPRSGVSYGVRRSPRFPKTCFPVMKANITVPAQIFNIVFSN